jgi:hypothetical protein
MKLGLLMLFMVVCMSILVVCTGKRKLRVKESYSDRRVSGSTIKGYQKVIDDIKNKVDRMENMRSLSRDSLSIMFKKVESLHTGTGMQSTGAEILLNNGQLSRMGKTIKTNVLSSFDSNDGLIETKAAMLLFVYMEKSDLVFLYDAPVSENTEDTTSMGISDHIELIGISLTELLGLTVTNTFQERLLPFIKKLRRKPERFFSERIIQFGKKYFKKNNKGVGIEFKNESQLIQDWSKVHKQYNKFSKEVQLQLISRHIVTLLDVVNNDDDDLLDD